MEDTHKTKEHLIDELESLRQKVANLERQNAERKRLEVELRETEEKFAAAFLNHPVPMAITAVKDGRYIDVNRSYAENIGLRREELIGQTSISCGLLTPEQRVLGLKEFREKGRFRNLEQMVTTKGGEKRWGLLNSVKIKFKDEECFLTVVTDITDRKNVEEAQHESEERYHNFFQNAVIGATQVTPDGRILRANNAAAKNMGYASPEELMKEVGDVKAKLYVDPKRREEGVKLLEKNGYLENFEAECWHKDGHKIWLSFNSRIVRDAQRNIIYYEATHQDITERKQLEKALSKSEQRYRNLFETTQDAIFIVDQKTGRFIDANSSACQLYGYSKNELQQLKPIDVSAEPEKTAKAVQNSVVNVPLRLHRKKDGTIFPVEISGGYFMEDERKIHTAVIRDISDRNHAEKLLRESEERFSLLANGSFEGIFIHKEGIILDLNNTVAEIFGYQIDEMIGRSVLDFVAPESRDMIIYKYKEYLKKEVFQYESYHIKKDNTVFPVEVQSKPICYKGIDARIVAFRDITVRKKNELALQQAESKFRKIFYGSPIPMAISTVNKGIITEVNDSYLSGTGCSRDEVIGKTAWELGFFVDIQRRNKVMDSLTEEGVTQKFDTEFKTKNGKVGYCRLTVDFIDLPDGKYILTSAIDITDKKRAEEVLNKLNEELETKVAERTSELVNSNNMLLEEIEKRNAIEDALRTKEKELEIKTINLTEMNTALNVLLKRKNTIRSDIEKSVVTNEKEIIFPYLERLRTSNLDSFQKNLLDIVEKSMEELISPFVKNLKKHHMSLTSREMEVAYLIKEGKTSKAIASVLGMTLATVDFHRLNIRRKLGIKNQAANLRTILTSFIDYEE